MNKVSRYISLNIKPYRIIRDVILVGLFAFMGGGIVGHRAPAAGGNNFGTVLSGIFGTLFMMTIGLSIVGAINPKNRWFHLAIVTAIVCVGPCLISRSITLFTVFSCLALYGVGGLLSMLYPVFRNRGDVQTVEPTPAGDKVDNEQGGE